LRTKIFQGDIDEDGCNLASSSNPAPKKEGEYVTPFKYLMQSLICQEILGAEYVSSKKRLTKLSETAAATDHFQVYVIYYRYDT